MQNSGFGQKPILPIDLQDLRREHSGICIIRYPEGAWNTAGVAGPEKIGGFERGVMDVPTPLR
jgi:hypothetical protein